MAYSGMLISSTPGRVWAEGAGPDGEATQVMDPNQQAQMYEDLRRQREATQKVAQAPNPETNAGQIASAREQGYNGYNEPSGIIGGAFSSGPPPTGAANGNAAPANGNGGVPGSSSRGIISSSRTGATQLGSPTAWTVDPSQTVEGRINNIVNPNNPIIQQARARSQQMASDRGLQNTSMAITAGDAAAYDVAMPIAQADAATFSKAAGYNADQSNQFAVRNMDADNSFLMADKQIAGQKDIALINRETQVTLAKLDAESRTIAAKFAADHETLLSTNSIAATSFNSAVAAVNNINLSTTMDGATKTRAVAGVWQSLQSQYKVLSATTGLNIGSTLNFAQYPGFDAQGNWVGFGEDGQTAGSGDAAAPAPAPYVNPNTY